MKKLFLFILFFFITFLNVSAKEEYLKNILIDGVALSEFNTEKDTYELKYDKTKEDINVVFEYDKDLFQLQTTGNTGKLSYGLNIITATLTRKSDETKEDKVTYTLNITREDERSNDNTLSSLTVGGKSVVLTDKEEYDVLVDNKLKSVEIKGVIKDQKSSFVDGYGERTGNNAVSLNGEKTKVEIKVKAENESIKTYVINIIKENYQSNDATLKSLGIKDINYDFKANIFEYNLTVKYEIDSININPVANHEKASLVYDKENKLVVGDNIIKVSVKAEDGTVNIYKLNIKREKEIPIVSNIEIKDIDFEFDYNEYEYEINTDLSHLDFNVILNSQTATSNILNNENLENGSIISIEVVDGEKKLIYKFKIIKEEIEDEITEENKEEVQKPVLNKEEKNHINEFLDKYEMYIGLGVFGIGLLSLLVAILTKTKKSQIM